MSDASRDSLVEPPVSGGDVEPRAFAIRSVVDRAVTRTERLFAVLRAGFALVVFGLFVASEAGQHFSLQFALELFVCLAAVGFSVWVARRSKQRVFRRRELVLSVCVDAGLCAAGLFTNVLAPGHVPFEIFLTFDAAIVPLVVFSSFFRVSKAAVLASGAAHALGVSAVALADVGTGPLPDRALALFCVYFALAFVAALFATRRAEEIFWGIAEASFRAEAARGSVFALLQDHHDLRSTLFDLQLNAERLAERAEAGAGDLTELRERLVRGIGDLGRATSRTRDRALATLGGLEAPSAANPERAWEDAVASLGARARELSLERRTALGPEVVFGGGTEGLARVLAHLLVNALEGDGTRGASRVSIAVSELREGFSDFVLEDDGPGIAEKWLEILGRERATSSKPDSAGIGLWLTGLLVRAVGGRLRFERAPAGGARVSVRLPRAAPDARR